MMSLSCTCHVCTMCTPHSQHPHPSPLQDKLGQVAEACQDIPMALHVAAAALQHGDLSPDDFLRLYGDPGLPAQTTVPAALMETPLDGLANAAKDNLHRWALGVWCRLVAWVVKYGTPAMCSGAASRLCKSHANIPTYVSRSTRPQSD